MAKYQVQRANELAKKLKSYSSKAVSDLDKAILAGAIKIESSAKRYSPVDTGYLRASITHQFYRNASDPYALVGTNVEYARYLEFGTKRITAKPYLRPAFEENVNAILKEIKEAYRF